MMEALRSMKRAGADILITYFAKRAAELLRERGQAAGKHAELPVEEVLVAK
jgi:delta-aminolevulinic acid dehydratase